MLSYVRDINEGFTDKNMFYHVCIDFLFVD